MIFTGKSGRNYLFVGVASSSIKVVDQVGGHGGVFRFHVRSVRKIVNLDDHVALACAGLKADARVLINKARIECQNHKLTVEDPVEYITRLQLQIIAQHYLTSSGMVAHLVHLWNEYMISVFAEALNLYEVFHNIITSVGRVLAFGYLLDISGTGISIFNDNHLVMQLDRTSHLPRSLVDVGFAGFPSSL
ncbi:proteasome subunit alpha type-7 [Tanacetum coccineum]